MTILLLGADGQVGYELHRAFAPVGAVVAYTFSGSLPGGARCGRIDFAEAGFRAPETVEQPDDRAVADRPRRRKKPVSA